MEDTAVGSPERIARIAEIKAAFRRAQEVIDEVVKDDDFSADAVSAKEMLDTAIEWLKEYEYQ